MGRPSFFEKFSEKIKPGRLLRSLTHCQALMKNQRLTKEKLFLKIDKDEIIWRI